MDRAETITKDALNMIKYAFTLSARPCVIKTYGQVEIGSEQGYVASTFVVENDGHSLCLSETATATS
jgi:hypothetical protein